MREKKKDAEGQPIAGSMLDRKKKKCLDLSILVFYPIILSLSLEDLCKS